MAVAIAVAFSAFAQTKNQSSVPSAANALADVKSAIDRGNEGWAKGDAAMVAAIFTEDGVQLAASGKFIERDAKSSRVVKSYELLLLPDHAQIA